MGKIPKVWFLLALALPVLTGCPAKVDPTPTPEQESLSISLPSPFTSDGNGNWTGEMPSDNSSADITVSSTSSWNASSDCNWCILSLTSGRAKDTNTTFSLAGNNSYEDRSCTITVSSGKLACSVKITQKGKIPEEFTVTPGEVEIESGGGTFEVKVTCATSYKLSSKPDWVTDETKSNPDKVHSFSVAANPEAEVRSGVLVFCDDVGVCLPISITQKAREGTVYQIDWSKDFYHRSLFMDFTGTWCGYCPRMQRGMRMVTEEYPDRINVVALHDNGSTLKFPGTAALQGVYSVTGFPNVIVDGRCKISNSGDQEGNYKKLLAAYSASVAGLPTVTAIAVSSSLDGDRLSVMADVYVKKSGSYKFTLFLLESGLVAAQADNDYGSSNDYIHDHVARIACSSVKGDEFKTASDNSIVSFSYSVSVPGDYTKDNLTLLAFVQRAYDGSVAKINASDYNGYFIDNSISAPICTYIPPAVGNSSSGGSEDFTGGNPVNW